MATVIYGPGTDHHPLQNNKYQNGWRDCWEGDMKYLLQSSIVLLSLTSSASAEFLLNFSGSQSTCAIHGQHCDGAEVGQTAFGRSTVVDPDTGLVYWHILTGKAAEGFVQDVYIQQASAYGTFQGGNASASLGGVNAKIEPLSIGVSGSTTANPSRVILRQFVKDDEISIDFIKDKYDRKPVINQTLSTPEMVNTFAADMRNSTYSDMTTQADVIWSVQLTGPNALSYDSTQVQAAGINAGMYKYNPASSASGAGGSYTYSDGGYSKQDAEADWPNLFDNTSANPWSYTANRPTP